MFSRVTGWFLAWMLLIFSGQSFAATLSDIQVSNGDDRATIALSFVGQPEYTLTKQGKQTLVLDIKQTGILQGLPLVFSGNNLVKSLRGGASGSSDTLRLIIDLTQPGNGQTAISQKNANVILNVIIKGDTPPAPNVTSGVSSVPPSISKNPFTAPKVTGVTGTRTPALSTQGKNVGPVVIAIDAGHGGKDPGAIGQSGTMEKHITLAIARKLQALLNKDPLFKGVMTRNGDYFISVMGRSDVARKQNANLLVSIHADAAPNRDASGASVWVLSNRRADSEMASWLEQHEKQSELLGGAGDMLANNQADPYLSQAVLDLQFGHSQRVGYDVAQRILSKLQQVGTLHKRRPEHASLGVLRSPDIPSMLIETGFISNSVEEKRLANDRYQQQLAEAIYQGLRSYFLDNPLQSAPGELKPPQ